MITVQPSRERSMYLCIKNNYGVPFLGFRLLNLNLKAVIVTVNIIVSLFTALNNKMAV